VQGDAPPAPPLAGVHAYDVQATITVTGNAPLPATHAFTLVIDADQQLGFAGSLEGGGHGALSTSDNRTFVITGPFSFSFKTACFASVGYDALTITLSADGRLTGTATGKGYYGYSDVATPFDASVAFDGGPDTVPPTLSIAGDADPTDPFVGVSLAASEPLPLGTRPTLTSTSGDVFSLAPPGGTMGPSLSGFAMPAVMLRYGEGYRVKPETIVDFAGNVAAAAVQFQTRAAPPLAAEDGFESVTAASLGGAQVITAANGPVITGQKSLYLPPSGVGLSGTRSTLALRLAVQSGDTVVRFSYRTVNPVGFGGGTSFGVGAVGKPIVWKAVTDATGATQTPATINQANFQLGPVSTAEIALPAGATGEVVLDSIASGGGCGLPPPPPPGIIIDDLRVE
jgi:hypothetical protein